jgi:glycosyltransferase involved in cell wall biosynthesis
MTAWKGPTGFRTKGASVSRCFFPQVQEVNFADPRNRLNRKPRILLIPNVAWWIIGEMGKQIIARFGDKYDFYFVPETVLERRPDLLRALVPAVDAIHCLNESSIQLFRNFDQETVPPIATWIHHVTTWSPDHQMAIERSAALTVCTLGWKEYLDARVSGQIPVTIVPHGVDTKFFQKKNVHSKRFGVPDGRFVLGFVGNKGSDSDRGRKGTDILLDVVRKAAGRLPNLHVVLGGPGWEKELAELRTLGISASATGYIRKSDLPALYSALDVYLLTSRVEGGPCTVFEAMACETAVVSTRVGAVPELIVDGVNGYSADVDDSESLVSAIVALGQAPGKRNEIGTSARETVSALPWGAVLSPLEGVYDHLLQLRSGNAPPLQGPAWMEDPQALLRVSCAADALANVVPRLRNRSMSAAKGIRMLMEMLNGQSIVDIAKGAAMLWGPSFKKLPCAGL